MSNVCSDHSLPVSPWGLSTGFDSGDPRCRRKIENNRIQGIGALDGARNQVRITWISCE
jgi:hypothetical protein